MRSATVLHPTPRTAAFLNALGAVRANNQQTSSLPFSEPNTKARHQAPLHAASDPFAHDVTSARLPLRLVLLAASVALFVLLAVGDHAHQTLAAVLAANRLRAFAGSANKQLRFATATRRLPLYAPDDAAGSKFGHAALHGSVPPWSAHALAYVNAFTGAVTTNERATRPATYSTRCVEVLLTSNAAWCRVNASTSTALRLSDGRATGTQYTLVAPGARIVAAASVAPGEDVLCVVDAAGSATAVACLTRNASGATCREYPLAIPPSRGLATTCAVWPISSTAGRGAAVVVETAAGEPVSIAAVPLVAAAGAVVQSASLGLPTHRVAFCPGAGLVTSTAATGASLAFRALQPSTDGVAFAAPAATNCPWVGAARVVAAAVLAGDLTVATAGGKVHRCAIGPTNATQAAAATFVLGLTPSERLARATFVVNSNRTTAVLVALIANTDDNTLRVVRADLPHDARRFATAMVVPLLPAAALPLFVLGPDASVWAAVDGLLALSWFTAASGATHVAVAVGSQFITAAIDGVWRAAGRSTADASVIDGAVVVNIRTPIPRLR